MCWWLPILVVILISFCVIPNPPDNSNGGWDWGWNGSGSGNPQNFNVSNYLGVWYQIADIPQFYEYSCSDCVQATYGAYSATNISVFNEALNPITNQTCQIQGYAYMRDPNSPTQLLVVFPSIPMPPAPYWIIQVGPVIENQYSFAVVSNPTKTTLYILSRKTEMNPLLFENIIQNLRFQNYPVSRLVKTNQIDC